MGTQYKKEGEAYHVTSEGGPYTIRRETVGVNITLSNVRRLASRGTDLVLHEKDGIRSTRVINGDWKAEHCHFELISEEGERRLRAPGHFQISVADFEHSSLSHFSAMEEMEEQFYLHYCLPEEWFDWLWEEIGKRPDAVVAVRSHIFPWLSGIEGHMWYEDMFRAIRLEHEERGKVLDATFYVGDAEQNKVDPSSDEESNGAPAPSFTDRIERQLETKDSDVWLKRIFWALVLIGFLLLIKLG